MPPRVSSTVRRRPASGRTGTGHARRSGARPADRRRARGVRRSHGLPWPVRLLLTASVSALGVFALMAASGGLPGFVSGLGGAIGSAVSSFDATPTPTPVAGGPLAAPVLDQPIEAYTNQPTVAVSGRLPSVVVGLAGYRIRLYAAAADAPAVKVAEIEAPGSTALFTIPGVGLANGANEFTATVVDATGAESSPSEPVRYVLDRSIPRVVLTAPKDGATVAGATLDLVGTTQSRSALVARNEANGAVVTGTAAGDGSFTLTIPVVPGPNGISIQTTDPAGNTSTLELAVTRSGEALTVTLGSSAYRLRVSKLPATITLTATVIGPDGGPLVGTAALFSLSIPGVPVITGTVTTDATGIASFRVTVPAGAGTGTVPATVFVSVPGTGEASARTVITILP